MLHLHMTQIVFVVCEGGLTLRAGPLVHRARMTAGPGATSSLASGGFVIFIPFVVVIVLLLVFLLLLPTPVLAIRGVGLCRGFRLEARRAG